MITRLLWPIFAALLTGGLFTAMGMLIEPNGAAPDEIEASPSISITRIERDETSTRKERERPKAPERKDLPPPPPVTSRLQPNNGNQGGINFAFDPVVPGEMRDFSTPSDRQATPVVRIPPQYPHRALTQNIEGWVLVEFTITIAGTVADVTVIDAEPRGVFDKAAIRAIERWKYQPKIVDGQPVAQTRMQELIRFVLENP